MPAIDTIAPGDIVTLHANGNEHRVQYLCHDQERAIVQLVFDGAVLTSEPLTVRWASKSWWISERATDEAFILTTADDPVLETIPPERE